MAGATPSPDPSAVGRRMNGCERNISKIVRAKHSPKRRRRPRCIGGGRECSGGRVRDRRWPPTRASWCVGPRVWRGRANGGVRLVGGRRHRFQLRKGDRTLEEKCIERAGAPIHLDHEVGKGQGGGGGSGLSPSTLCVLIRYKRRPATARRRENESSGVFSAHTCECRLCACANSFI